MASIQAIMDSKRRQEGHPPSPELLEFARGVLADLKQKGTEIEIDADQMLRDPKARARVEEMYARQLTADKERVRRATDSFVVYAKAQLGVTDFDFRGQKKPQETELSGFAQRIILDTSLDIRPDELLARPDARALMQKLVYKRTHEKEAWEQAKAAEQAKNSEQERTEAARVAEESVGAFLAATVGGKPEEKKPSPAATRPSYLTVIDSRTKNEPSCPKDLLAALARTYHEVLPEWVFESIITLSGLRGFLVLRIKERTEDGLPVDELKVFVHKLTNDILSVCRIDLRDPSFHCSKEKFTDLRRRFRTDKMLGRLCGGKPGNKKYKK